MIVVDVSVLIAHLDATDANHEPAKEMLLETAGSDLAASPITIAEVLVGPARVGRLDEARAALDDLAVKEVPVPEGAAQRLARLRASTGLKLPDCCVLLAAQHGNAEAVLTLNDRLAKRARELGYEWEARPSP